jgi:TolB-like protein/DNA-binding winged helix-turn-helix (wHTH) protein
MPLSQGPGKILRFGAFEADLESGELRKHGTRIRLQEQPFRILATLLERAGQVVSREELERILWPEQTFVDAGHGVNSAVTRLRQALSDSAETPRFIETVPRRGYRFIALITAQTAINGTTLGNPVPGTPAIGPAQNVTITSSDEPSSRKKLVIVGIAVTLALSAAITIYSFSRPTEAIRSIAVLPFANTAADPNLEFLGDGITETLINDLSRLQRLRVLARTTVLRYKNRKTDPASADKELQVDAVVAGEVQSHSGRLLVQAHLIKTADGSQIWGERYGRPGSDGLAIYDEIARNISQHLRISLTLEDKRRISNHGTSDSQAYEFYLRGLHHLNKRSEEGFRKALDDFSRATERDPKYALAFAGISHCYVLLANYLLVPPQEAEPKAKAAAMRAIELDDMLAEGHLGLAMYYRDYDWDRLAAEREFLRAVELSPNSAQPHTWYGELLCKFASPQAGLAQFQIAKQLEPVSLNANSQLGFGLYMLRRYDAAIAQLQRTLELDPGYTQSRRHLGYVYLAKGMFDDAIAEFKKVIDLSQNTRDFGLLAQAYGMAGRRKEALGLLRDLEEFAAHHYVSPVQIAGVYMALGDNNQAISLLEQAYVQRSPALRRTREPAWDRLHSDPRFLDLMNRIHVALL